MKQNILHILLALVFLTNCQINPKAEVAPSTLAKAKFVRVEDKSKEALLSVPYRSLDTSKKILTFGFGSCNDQSLEQPLWKNILSRQFDLFVMTGDNIYTNKKDSKSFTDQYILLNQNQDYKKLRESTPFLATWDDYDFGQNDGGSDNPEKESAKISFLNYWIYLKQILPKNQKAIYHSRILGSKKERVQFLMLDTRWDRSPLVRNPEFNPETQKPNELPKIYLPTLDTSAHFLGEDQWTWLEAELKKPAELRILVSSVQFIANDHYFEKWGNFPHERQRLLNILKKNKIKNLVIISGDRHLAAISKLERGSEGALFDITSSALNRPSRNLESEKDAAYTSPAFLKINYGAAQIDWSHRKVTFNILDAEDKVQLSQDVSF